MLRAFKEVRLHNKTIRSTSKVFQVNYRTLARNCSKISPSEVAGDGIDPSLPLGFHQKSFSFQGGARKSAGRIHHHFLRHLFWSPVVCKLAYTYESYNNVPVRTNWAEKETAGTDWFSAIEKRHPSLSIRTLEATSLAPVPLINTMWTNS